MKNASNAFDKNDFLCQKDVKEDLDNYNIEARMQAINSPSFQPKYIEKALDDGYTSVRAIAANSASFDPKWIQKTFAGKEEESARLIAVKSGNFDKKYIEVI